jgi:hypothetical protein
MKTQRNAISINGDAENGENIGGNGSAVVMNGGVA